MSGNNLDVHGKSGSKIKGRGRGITRLAVEAYANSSEGARIYTVLAGKNNKTKKTSPQAVSSKPLISVSSAPDLQGQKQVETVGVREIIKMPSTPKERVEIESSQDNVPFAEVQDYGTLDKRLMSKIFCTNLFASTP